MLNDVGFVTVVPETSSDRVETLLVALIGARLGSVERGDPMDCPYRLARQAESLPLRATPPHRAQSGARGPLTLAVGEPPLCLRWAVAHAQRPS